MKTTIVLTTSMSQSLALWLTECAKKYKVTKKTIIETALKKYRDDLKRNEFAESFKKAARDMDIIAMAEDGLADYNDQLGKL